MRCRSLTNESGSPLRTTVEILILIAEAHYRLRAAIQNLYERCWQIMTLVYQYVRVPRWNLQATEGSPLDPVKCSKRGMEFAWRRQQGTMPTRGRVRQRNQPGGCLSRSG